MALFLLPFSHADTYAGAKPHASFASAPKGWGIINLHPMKGPEPILEPLKECQDPCASSH